MGAQIVLDRIAEQALPHEHDVGALACFQRADPIGHAQDFRTADRRAADQIGGPQQGRAGAYHRPAADDFLAGTRRQAVDETLHGVHHAQLHQGVRGHVTWNVAAEHHRHAVLGGTPHHVSRRALHVR
ncbi:hypothetical protein D9M69_657900 [compost metagenome]